MKSKFSTAWKSSKQPRKQRKYRANAPLHLKGRFLTVRLSKQLAERHKVKRTRLKVDDKVKVLRGKYRGKEGKVEILNLRKSTAKISGIEVSKIDGSKAKVPIHASNLMITDLTTDDKKRLDKQAKKENEKKEKKD